MAKEEKTTTKQSKRHTQIGLKGGGNVGGLLLLGGALAVGSLVATFAARKGNRQKGSGENRNRKEDQSSQGLHFVLKSSSSEFQGNQCCAGDGSTETIEDAHIEPTQLDSTDHSVLEENPSSEVNKSHKNSDKRDQEILLPKDPKQGSIELCDGGFCADETQLPEVNIPSLDKLDEDSGNNEAKVNAVEFAEEDAVDGVQTSREETTLVESTKEEDDDDTGNKKQPEESLILEENIALAEKTEPTTVNTAAEKFSVTPEEEDDVINSNNESPFEEIIEVKQEKEEDTGKVEAEDVIDFVEKRIEENSSVNSIDEKEDNKQQVPEKSFLEEKTKFAEEGEPIGVSIVDKDRVVIDNFQMELHLKDIIEVRHEAKDEAAEDDAMNAVKMCIEENLLLISSPHDNNTGKKLSIDENEDRGDINSSKDDQILSKKSEDNLELNANEFKTAGFEAYAQLLATKTEQDEKNQSKEFNCFNSSKNNSLNGFADINQTRKSSTFAQKEENLEFAVCNKQQTIFMMSSRFSVEIMLMVASIVLLFLTYCYGLS